MATMVIQTCFNVTLHVHCLVECVLVDFRHGVPNYRKSPYKENPKNRALSIKGPILVCIYTLTHSLTLSLFSCKYLILNGMCQ